MPRWVENLFTFDPITAISCSSSYHTLHPSPILSHLHFASALLHHKQPQEPARCNHAVHRANLPLPPIVLEMLYPAGVYVERTLRVWAMSRWRGARGVTNFFLGAGYGHLPRGSPRMYRVEEVIHNGVVVAILAHFTNPFDAFYLLGCVF